MRRAATSAMRPSIASLFWACAGNFRLLDRMLPQITRVLEINDLQNVASEVVDAARESLVIGTI